MDVLTYADPYWAGIGLYWLALWAVVGVFICLAAVGLPIRPQEAHQRLMLRLAGWAGVGLLLGVVFAVPWIKGFIDLLTDVRN
jgi:hypothetical protein